MSFHNKSVSAHQFSMTPRADIPRAAFNIEFTHKTTFDSGWLIPVFCEEVLPGDSYKVDMTAFARLSTPIFPLMDNLHLDTFFFFVPNRLVWEHWANFMGEQANPDDTTSYTVPFAVWGVPGASTAWPANSIGDYYGLPIEGQAPRIGAMALPFRMYNLIYNEWFRDQNLVDRAVVKLDDTPDDASVLYPLRRRAKRPDYFTTCLPWPQKGEAVTLPIGASAPIVPVGNGVPTFGTVGGSEPISSALRSGVADNAVFWDIIAAGDSDMKWINPALEADLSTATAVTVNALRASFQIQKLLERDARGGTRYTEIVRSHFGVISPDARLQRPEYLGGSSTPVQITPIAQTSATGAYAETPQGNLAAIGTCVSRARFAQAFTEHGYIIGLANVRADVTYQQGLRRHWQRSTRYDFYMPVFAMLGEQPVLNNEIYALGEASDVEVFGYQERWSEYRYAPNQVSGLFRSTTAGTLDAWHLAERFTGLPVLGEQFIESKPPLPRVLAVGAAAGGAEFLFDSVFRMRVVRPLPMYSVPGMIDHF